MKIPIINIIDKYDNELLEILLKKGNTPNCRNFKYQTPLHIAVILNDLEKVKLLLKYGAKFDALDKKKLSAMQYAGLQENIEILEFLIEYKKKN